MTSDVTGDQAVATCVSGEVNLANGLTVPMRRGGRNTIRLRRVASAPNSPPSPQQLSVVHRTSVVPAIPRVLMSPSWRLRRSAPVRCDTQNLGPRRPDRQSSINPGYSISTNMMPQIGTVRKGDTVTLAGRDLDAGSMKVEPACVALVGRTANNVQLKYNCEVQAGFQGTMTTVKMFPQRRRRAALRAVAGLAHRQLRCQRQTGPHASARSIRLAPFRPVTAGSNNVDASFCRNLPPPDSVVTAFSTRPTAPCATSTAGPASHRALWPSPR